MRTNDEIRQNLEIAREQQWSDSPAATEEAEAAAAEAARDGTEGGK